MCRQPGVANMRPPCRAGRQHGEPRRQPGSRRGRRCCPHACTTNRGVGRRMRTRLWCIDAELSEQQGLAGCQPRLQRRIEQPILGANGPQSVASTVQATADQHICALAGHWPCGVPLFAARRLQHVRDGVPQPFRTCEFIQGQMLPAVHCRQQIVIAKRIDGQQSPPRSGQSCTAQALCQRPCGRRYNNERHGIQHCTHGMGEVDATRSAARGHARPLSAPPRRRHERKRKPHGSRSRPACPP